MKSEILTLAILTWFTFCNAQTPMGDIPDEVVYGKLRFKINTGYVSATIGPSSFLSKPLNFTLLNYGIDYRRPRDKEDDKYDFYNFGLYSWGTNRYFRTYSLHAGYGKRKPRRYSNLCYSFGISYSFGWLPVNGKKDTLLYNRNPGIFAEFEYVYKPYYDVGVGPKVFINYDLSYPTYGVGISLYFSNSYKGKSRNINDSQQ
jgi:hypothetical protein